MSAIKKGPLEMTYPDTLSDIGDIPSGTLLRDWFEDGIRVIVLRGPFHPCVYFGVPESHPLAGHDSEYIPLNVHGGLTFSDAGDGKWRPKGFWWYGYDYGHSGDFMFEKVSGFRISGKQWTLGEIVKDTWDGLYDLKKLMKLAEAIANQVTRPPARGKGMA